ncbi:DUF4097 family beta strand repeat-containing protein [Streptomyces sp. JNUCC 64]
MSDTSEWSIATPRRLDFDAPVTTLRVRVANGTVNVVGTDGGSTRLQVSEVKGPPLIVTHEEDGVLTVTYEDLTRKGLVGLLSHMGLRHSAVVSLVVPASTRVEVSVVGAGAVVSGVEGHTEVKSVTGDTTLVGLGGTVRVETVSGNIEVKSLTGALRFSSVSGDLTVVEGSGAPVRAESVSGSMIVDIDPADDPTDVRLNSVSGEIAIRLPHPADAEVEANSASGHVSTHFEDLRVSGQWGAKRITGRLGEGNGTLKATTVSGAIALLRRPRADHPDAPTTAAPTGHGSEQKVL